MFGDRRWITELHYAFQDEKNLVGDIMWVSRNFRFCTAVLDGIVSSNILVHYPACM